MTTPIPEGPPVSNVPTELDRFVRLSSALTGLDASQLKPELDPIGIADQYLQTLKEFIDPKILQALLATVPSTPGEPVDVAALLDQSVLGLIGRSILKLWLLGAWYNPLNPSSAVKVVSSQAYKESLVWKAMQAHPMGYSMFSFGDWAEEPPPLDQFLTFSGTEQGEARDA
jgi:hypothetical protein